MVECRLAGHFAGQAKDLVTKDIVPKGLIIDLADVSYIDSVGEQLLNWLASVGAVFVARSVYAIAACERLHLALVKRPAERHKRRHGTNEKRTSTRHSYPVGAI